MQIVIEYIMENKKKVLLFIFFVILLSGLFILNDKKDDKKIYLSDDYVYTKELYEHNIGLNSELPYINIKDDEINEINLNLIKKYYEIITIDKQIMRYEYYVNDNILSLIISIYNQESPEISDEKLFYNIDLNNGRIITDNGLLDMFIISNGDVSDVIYAQLKDYYNYEIKNNYISSDCDFNCYLSSINSLSILDDCNYYVKDNNLYVYKYLSLDSNFYYDSNSGFDLYNFKIK